MRRRWYRNPKESASQYFGENADSLSRWWKTVLLKTFFQVGKVCRALEWGETIGSNTVSEMAFAVRCAVGAIRTWSECLAWPQIRLLRYQECRMFRSSRGISGCSLQALFLSIGVSRARFWILVCARQHFASLFVYIFWQFNHPLYSRNSVAMSVNPRPIFVPIYGTHRQPIDIIIVQYARLHSVMKIITFNN